MKKFSHYLEIIPFILCIGVVLILGVSNVVLLSLGEKGERFVYYKEILENDEFWKFLRYTTKLNLVTIIFGVGIGIFILYLIYKIYVNRYFDMEKYEKIFYIPVIMPYFITGYGVLLVFLFFSKRSIINLENYVNDTFGIGIILATLLKIIPFIVVMGLKNLKKSMNNFLPLKKIYYLSDKRYFKEVVLPSILSDINTGVFLIMIYLYNSYEIPSILGASYPKTLGVWLFEKYRKELYYNLENVMALNVIVALISMGISFFLSYSFKKILKIKKGEW